MPSSGHTSFPRLANITQVPQQYAKPIRKTGYLMAYPHIVHGGKMMPGEARVFPDVLSYNMMRNDLLTNLKMSNEVSYTHGRVMDVRGMQSIP